MTRTMSELLRQLRMIEPNERMFDGIGRAEVGLLRRILDEEEPWLAARAVYALSRIDSDDARQGIRAAKGDSRIEVRSAAAAIANSVPPELSDELLASLLEDVDIGVRKIALRSVSQQNSGKVRQRIEVMVARERNPRLKEMAVERVRTVFPR